MEKQVEEIKTPIRLEYRHTAGDATTRFLRALKEGRILGQRCPKCRLVIVPARGACARCGVPTREEVEREDGPRAQPEGPVPEDRREGEGPAPLRCPGRSCCRE